MSIDKTQVEKARAAGLTTVQLGFQDFAGLKKNVVMTAGGTRYRSGSFAGYQVHYLP